MRLFCQVCYFFPVVLINETVLCHKRKEYMARMMESGVLRRVLGPKGKEIA